MYKAIKNFSFSDNGFIVDEYRQGQVFKQVCPAIRFGIAIGAVVPVEPGENVFEYRLESKIYRTDDPEQKPVSLEEVEHARQVQSQSKKTKRVKKVIE